MKISRTGTSRFASVVEAAGKPEVIFLWFKPERDEAFMRAVRQNRVMTIKQANVSSSKDFGIVGFLRDKGASYLVFPKSLAAFKGKRIVGVKYDLIATSGPVGRVVHPEAPSRKKHSRKVQPAEWVPTRSAPTGKPPAKNKKFFKVTIRFIATAEVASDVEAPSKAKARETALQQVVPPNFQRGTITRKVIRVTAA